MLRLMGTGLLILHLICLNDIALAQPRSVPWQGRYGDSLEKLDVEGVRRALKEGANPNERYAGTGASAVDRVVGSTLLPAERVTRELEEKVVAVLEVLLDAGATLNITILHAPTIKGARLVTKYLLDRGANPNGADRDGNTPVTLATKYGHPDIVSLLVEYGAKRLDAATDAQIRFIVAAKRGDLIAIRHELARGAQVNGRLTGQTALIEAIDRGNFSVVTELLQLGASSNLPGRYMAMMVMSPLHAAVYSSGRYGLAMVDALLKAGAHVSSTAHFQEQTPLHVAARLQNPKAVEILLKAGAKVMPRDADGKTPLDYAESGPVIELLKAAGAREQ